MVFRMQRAARGEARAPAWLEERGFAVLGAQVSVDHEVRVDDRVVGAALRADYLAEKDGARFVVEVKTGALAPSLESRATRRQLLEYRVAFDVDGVLLVDAETGSVHEVTFPALERQQRQESSSSASGWRAVALTMTLVAAAAVALHLARL